MEVTDQLISKLETLAKLKLSQNEKQALTGDLEKIIDMFSLIAEVDTEGVKPLRHMNENINVTRNDVPLQTLKLEDVVANAPKIINNQFAVPKVID